MIDIIVNGKTHQVKAGLSYEELVELAGLPSGHIYSITYRGPITWSSSGILAPGQHIVVMEGTIFNVFHTGSA